MGLMLLRRDAVGLALVQSATPGVNATTALYIGVTGVDDLHERCAARGARIVTGLADHPWGCATSWSRCPAATGWPSASASPSLASPALRQRCHQDRSLADPRPRHRGVCAIKAGRGMLACMANLVPVTLIVGEEEFLVDRALREAVAQARDALAGVSGSGDGGDLHDLEASALGQGELAALTSPSLFGGGAVVVVRNAQNAGKEIAAELAKYAKSPAPDAAVVLTHAGGAKGKALVTDLAKAGAQQVDCPKLTRASERTDFVRNEFRRVGRQADAEAVRALLDAIGGDLRELASAVDQLASDTDGRINAATVARYYRGRAEATGFSVADHAVEGRLNEALEQLRWALADRHLARPDHQRARDRGAATRPGRRGLAEREPQRARGRGRCPAVEDRPGAPATARLAPGRRGQRPAGRRRGGRPGQGRGSQPRVRPGTRDPPDRHLPRRPLAQQGQAAHCPCAAPGPE